MDNSSVFCRSMLDDEHMKNFDKEWIFETDVSIICFETEDEACEAQAEYRRKNNFDPITGE